MRILIILLFLLTSCMSSKKVDTSSFNENNLYDLSIEEYKEMLKNYNNNHIYILNNLRLDRLNIF